MVLKDNKTNKILIAIPFWKGDKLQAMKMARLLADIQQEHSQRADILFCARFDTTHDMKTVEYVSRKFNVHIHTSQRREVGWPHGCNGLFFGIMEWIHGRKEAKTIPAYRAVFLAESDGAPLSDDWIARLSLEWDKLNELQPVYMAGAFIPDIVNNHPHVNGGCCFLSTDDKFTGWITKQIAGIKSNAGWDWILNRHFEKWGWADMPSIKSEWHRPAFTEKEWDSYVKRGVVWLHGLHDDSLMEVARKKLL